MSLISAAHYRAEQLPESGIGTNMRSWLRSWLGGTDTPSGIKVDADNAISLSTVFNALLLLSESVAQLPLAPFIKEPNGDRTSRREFTEHFSYNLVAHEPNEWMSSYTFRKTLQSHLCRYDRAYALISRNGRGQPIELFPLHPKWVTTKITEDRRLIYEVSGAWGSTRLERINPINMLHLIGYTDNGLEGKSRVDILANGLGNAQAAERFTGHFFGKGINVSGFISTPKMLKDQEAVDRLKNSFVQRKGGPNNEWGVGVLEGGSEWIKNDVEPEKAQLNETRKVNGLTVAQIWNIPLPLLKYLESATYNNVEQLDIQFSKYTLAPWLINWEQEYRRKLLTESEKESGNVYFKHNMSGFLRGDTATRAEFYEKMQRTGAMSPNDIREKEDMNPYEGGDVHVVNPGAQTIEDLQNTIENMNRGAENNKPKLNGVH